jgi:hypothetical protein
MGQKIYESDKFLKTGGTSSQYLMADGTTSTGPTGGVDVGTGTANKVAKFSDSDTITDGIMTDDGTSVLVGGNLAIGIGDNDNLFHIEATDTTYDVSRAIEIDYTKSHSTTGWGASAFGVRVNVFADGTGQNADLQGGSFSAKHIGSGVTYYLLGSQSNAKHEGSGNTGAIWGAFNQAAISGTGTGTHPFLIGTNQKAELNNVNTSVGSMSGILAVAKTIGGDVTGRMDAAWLQIDGNQGSTTVVDANVLYLQADTGNITASGTMRTIHSVSTLPSLFLGSIESPKFFIGTSEANYLEENASGVTRLYGDGGIMIETSDGVQMDISDVVVVNSEVEATSIKRTGGTSSQFLKADGSVDSSTYSTTDTQPLTTEEVQDIVGAMVNSNTEQSISVTYSDGDGKLNFDAGAATFNHPTHPGDDASVDTGALTGAVVISDLDFNVTTDTFGHVTDANATVATRTLTLANLGFTGDVDATNDQTLNQVITSGNTYTNGTSIWTFDSGQISNVDSGEGWGVILSPEEGLLFTNGSGNTAGKSYVQSNAIAIGNGSYIGKIFTANLTAERSFELPNAAGTLALTSQISTDFVSAAGGGTFNGDIIADSFAVPGGASSRFLKADGSTDATAYNSGAGASGGVAVYNGTNTTTDDSNLQYNFLSSTLTSRNLDVAVDLNVGADLDVVGNITTDVIQADGWTYIPQTFQANFAHTGNNGYMNVPFNSLGDNASGGEQHFIVTPYGGHVYSVAFKNTATGTSMTATNMNFRVLVNGVTSHTSGTQTFTAAARTYKGWVLGSTDALFNAGDDLRFQFRCTSGLWQDTCAVVVLKCII